MNRQWFWLLLITVLGAALRMYHLSSWSIWVDEAHTWRDITTPLSVFWKIDGASNYPISYLIARAMVDWFGAYDPVWLRLPFAVIGAATVPLLGLLSISLVGSRAALLAALFLAVNPWHIYWSQNVRAYVLLTFFGTIAAVACFHGVQRRSRVLVALALVSAVLAGLCHPSGYLLLGTFVIYALLGERALPKVSVGVVVAGVVLLIGMIYLLAQAISVLQTFSRSKPDASLLHLAQTTAFYFRPALILTAGGAAVLAFKQRSRTGLFLVLWAAVPLLLICVVDVQVTARYAFVSLPAVLLLAGDLCTRISNALRALGSPLVGYLLAALLVVDMASYDYLYFNSQHGDRPRWREAVEYVRSRTGEEPFILTTNEATMNYYLRPDYYRGGHSGMPPVEVIVDFKIKNREGGAAFMRHILAETERQNRTLFVLITEPELQEQDVDGSVATYLREVLHQVARFPNWVGPKDQTITIYRQ